MDDVIDGWPTCKPEIPFLFPVISIHETSNPSVNFFASPNDGESVPGVGKFPERCANASSILSAPNLRSNLVATVSYPNRPSNCISPRNTRFEFDNSCSSNSLILTVSGLFALIRGRFLLSTNSFGFENDLISHFS